MDYIIRSYWDTISKKSSNNDGLDPYNGRHYDPRFGPNPTPFEPDNPKF